MDIPGAARPIDPEAWDKAQAEQERLLEDLKKEVRVEAQDIGTLRKSLRITVPEKIIADHLEHNYTELMHDALVPGFRKGRAPRKLIEKRFGGEVRESLTSSMVGQSYFAVIENEKLDVLGDPLFVITAGDSTKLMDIDEALQHLKLPSSGDFVYACEVELKPTFELPALENIPVRQPRIEITDAMVEEQLLHRRKLRGRMEPVADGAAEKNDTIVADVVLRVDGESIKQEDNVTLAVRPSSVEGIPLTDLDTVLTGVRPGQSVTADCTIPPDFERPDLRGKKGQFTFKIHEIKRLVPESLADFLTSWGFESEADARTYFREQLEAERDELVDRARRAQIEGYLLDHTTLDLPEQFSNRQIQRAVARKVIDLQQRGVPQGDIEARIDALRTSAGTEALAELKLSFILEKAAEQLGITVTDEEVNTEIARIARRYNRRFDRIRDDLQGHGLLDQLVEQIRQSKCVDVLLEKAQAVDGAEPAPSKPAAE